MNSEQEIKVAKMKSKELMKRLNSGETMPMVFAEHPTLVDLGLKILWVGPMEDKQAGVRTGLPGRVRRDRRIGVEYLCCGRVSTLSLSSFRSRIARSTKQCAHCSRKGNARAEGARRKRSGASNSDQVAEQSRAVHMAVDRMWPVSSVTADEWWPR